MKNKICNYITKFGNMPVAVKASIVYFIANIMQKGLGFITSPIYTRILSEEEYGTVSVYYSMEQLLGTIAMFCLGAGCFDIGMQKYKEDRNSFVFSLLILSNIITLFLSIILWWIYPIIEKMIQVNKTLLCVMFANFLLQPALTFWTRHERFEYKYRWSALITITSSVLSAIVSIIMISLLDTNHVYERIIGGFIPLAVYYVIFYFLLGKRSNFRINFKYWKFAFMFNLPLIPHYLSAYVLNSSDRLMISYLQGNAEAGYYSLAYSISTIVMLFWTAISSSLTPYILDKYEKKEFKKVSDLITPILTLFAVLCLVIIIFAPEAILLLGTKSYLRAVYAIPPIICGIFFQATYYVFTDALYYYKKPQYVMFASISTGLLNLLLNYIFIPIFGFIAAGYTTLICFWMQAVVDYIVSLKVVGVVIVEKKFLIKLSFTMITISILSNVLYHTVVWRYAIFGGILFMGYTNRKKIIHSLQRKESPD